MLPILFAGGAAALAFFLTGCGSTQKKRGKTLPAKIEPPKSDYKTDFHGDSLAEQLYLELQQKRVFNSHLDRGCPTYDFSVFRQAVLKKPGAGDHRVNSCEVYEFTLKHYETLPEIAEKITEMPIPWSLDDRNPRTFFDERVRALCQNVINQIAGILVQNGYRPESEDYQERMAVALLAFVSFPPAPLPEVLQAIQKMPLEEQRQVKTGLKSLQEEMYRLDLGFFWDTLSSSGGIRVRGQDNAQEMSALNALETSQGDCTELSKILFAIQKLAKLKPFFVLVDPLESTHPGAKYYVQKDPLYYHVSIGLYVKGRIRHFDPSLFSTDAPHKGSLALSLRQYLSMDLGNKFNELHDRGAEEQALETINKAILLNPNNHTAWINRMEYWIDHGNLAQAHRDSEAAYKINPHDPRLFLANSVIFAEQNNWEQVVLEANQGLQWYPNYTPLLYQRGYARFNKLGQKEKGLDDYKRILELSPVYFFKVNPKAAEAIFTMTKGDKYQKEWEQYATPLDRKTVMEEIEGDGEYIYSGIKVVSLLYKTGNKAEAVRRFTIWTQALAGIQKELKNQGKDFSPLSKEFLQHIFNRLTPPMRHDPEVVLQWTSLGIPLSASQE